MNTENNSNQLILNIQYIKDLSFENPGAPFGLVNSESGPEINVNVNVNAKTLQNDVYEVVIHLTINATGKEATVFLVDLQYAGVFTLNNFDEEDKEKILLIECPTIIFPFARRIVADVTRDGAIQTLMLDAIDFAKLFENHKEKINVNSLS